jgi:hypothetical protein
MDLQRNGDNGMGWDGLLPDLTIEPFNDSTPSGRLLPLLITSSATMLRSNKKGAKG